jgi:hypothetical protein
MELPPLEYEIPKQPTKNNRWMRWLAVAFVAIQVTTCPFTGFWAVGLLENGGPKQPFRDFLINVTPVLPSVFAAAFALTDLAFARTRADLIRNRKLSFIMLLVALLILGFVIYSWIDDDVINRNVPHGFW